MGLLTDPSSGQGKLTKFLIKYYGPICTILYVSGVIYFCALASPLFNTNTYFSENALLPGLVKNMFQEDRTALSYFQDLQQECQKYDKSIPYPWILAKFRQLGLDSYTHNFTLHSPLNPNETYYGKNVYGILRAPRASSTEALVLSVPYRPPSSFYATTLPSIAIQLAFAKFAAKEKYWAKDIIFLITDHEQLGIQAWLEAYHGVTCGDENTLDHGKLKGRAGAIQAAINLELHSTRISQIDIKIEGLNGQLPNLDLFNLAGKICSKEGIYYTFKGKTPEFFRDAYKEWLYYFKNMLSMLATQATGVPNGNHGLFLRFGIQALTLEGFEQSPPTSRQSRVGFMSIGRLLEGIFRSMNNLLERFHQSFFFYILLSYDRYISIGLYMPATCLIAAALIIKACAKWCKAKEEKSRCNKACIKVVFLFVILHIIGAILMTLPGLTKPLLSLLNLEASKIVFVTLLSVLVISLLLPYLLEGIRSCKDSLNMLCILSLLELGTAIICLSMNNIAIGMFCAAVIAPIALLVDTSTKKLYKIMQKILWFLVHPLVLVFIVVFISTYIMFLKENLEEILFKAFDATQQAVIYSIVDSMIFGNWLYTVVTTIFIPNWLCFWFIAANSLKTVESPNKKDN